MDGIVITLPIVAGKVEAWRRFCQEMAGNRRAEHEISRRRQGIRHEQLILDETKFRATALVYFAADNVGRALDDILVSTLPFDRWYREQVQILHGIKLATYDQFSQEIPLLNNQKLLFEWGLPLANHRDEGESDEPNNSNEF